MEAEENFKERRVSARIKGTFNITITESHEKVAVHAIDLSASGLRFKSPKNIPLFREIALELSLPGKNPRSKEAHFRCHAIVVRSEKSQFDEGYSVALTFVDVSKKDKNSLMKFLENSTENQEDPNSFRERKK